MGYSTVTVSRTTVGVEITRGHSLNVLGRCRRQNLLTDRMDRRKRKESRIALRLLARAAGEMELPFTDWKEQAWGKIKICISVKVKMFLKHPNEDVK